ncbi:MAG: BTAD domain-containing putative transcriptional regulator [Ilumatobacter sp.]
MARPFRLHPPDLAEGMVLRVGVQSALAGRFDRMVTCLVGGAGFGKTTALVQAFAENELHPLGHDIWLACQPGDAASDGFALGLLTAFDAPSAPVSSVADVVIETMAARSPSAVALVLDDVQFLTDPSSRSILDDIVRKLPANAHLVLSGRMLPDIALTRLDLIGECEIVREMELAFSTEEAAQMLGVDHADTAAFGGWPALIQLSRTGRAVRFVQEEVTSLLDSAQLSVLRCLVAVGEADAELLSELAATDAESVLATTPLVHRRGELWAAHDLWADVVGSQKPGGDGQSEADDIRRRAAELGRRRRQPAWAVDVMLRSQLIDHDANSRSLDAALRDALLRTDRVEPHVLRRWHDHIFGNGVSNFDAGSAHQSAPRSLLGGLISRLDNPGSEDCHAWLRLAASQFIEEADDEASVAALASLVFAYHVRRDVPGLLWAFGELMRFAERGVRSAAPYPLLAGALVATSASEPLDVVGHCEPLLGLELPVELRAVALWLYANALGNLGRSSVEPAAECYALGLPLPGMAMIYSAARWRAGMAREMADNPITPLDGARDRFLMSTWECCLAASMGDAEAARKHLAVIEASSANEAQWQTAGSIEMPKATVLYNERRDVEATDLLRTFLSENPATQQAYFYRMFAIGLVYVLVPEERAWFEREAERESFGPLYQRDLDLVRALVAVIEHGDLDAVEALDFPVTAGELMPSVGVRNGTVLLAAAVAAGRTDLGDLIEDFIELVGATARSRWRELADGEPGSIADGARQIIESMPVPPRRNPELRLLGSSELIIDGRPVEHPDWRRERVRALLTFLSLHPDTTREHVMAALWPDAAADSARRSLRTTLNMLLAVLEPDRSPGDASFFLRSSGQRLRLVLAERGSPGLLVDIGEFESKLDEAEHWEAAGIPSRSIEPFRVGVAVYRGDLLTDGYDDWVMASRDRLRGRFLAASSRLGELLLATHHTSEAIAVASRALEVEPWSEPSHRVLIAAHLDKGDLATARRLVATCEQALADVGGPSDGSTLELFRRLERR